MTLKQYIASKLLHMMGRNPNAGENEKIISYPPKGENESQSQYMKRVPIAKQETLPPVELDYRGKPRVKSTYL